MCSRKVFPVGRRSIRSIIHFQSQIPSFTAELTVDLQHKGQIILGIIVKIRSRSFIQKCFVRPTLLISTIPPVTCHIAILRTKHQIGDWINFPFQISIRRQVVVLHVIAVSAVAYRFILFQEIIYRSTVILRTVGTRILHIGAKLHSVPVMSEVHA